MRVRRNVDTEQGPREPTHGSRRGDAGDGAGSLRDSDLSTDTARTAHCRESFGGTVV